MKLLQAILIARLAGPVSMGVYVAAVAIPLILVRVVELGLSQSLGYFTRFESNFFPHALRILFLHIVAALGPILICIFLARYYSFGDEEVNAIVRTSMLFIAGSVAAQLFTGVITPMLVAMERGSAYTFVSLAPPALFMSVMVTAHFAGFRISPEILILCDVSANGITAIVIAMLCWNSMREAVPVSTRRAEVYSYGLQSYPGILSKVVALRLDRVILAALLPPASLALYSIATSLRDVAMTPSNIFSVTFQNQLVDKVKHSLPYRGVVWRTAAAWFAMFSCGNLIFWFTAPWLLPLIYGKHFIPAVPVARILMLSTLFLSVAGFCWMLMVALRRPALISASNVLGGVLSVWLLWFMARNYGLIGAAWSSVISSAIIMIAAVIAVLLLRPAAGASAVGASEGRHIT